MTLQNQVLAPLCIRPILCTHTTPIKSLQYLLTACPNVSYSTKNEELRVYISLYLAHVHLYRVVVGVGGPPVSFSSLHRQLKCNNDLYSGPGAFTRRHIAANWAESS